MFCVPVFLDLGPDRVADPPIDSFIFLLDCHSSQILYITRVMKIAIVVQRYHEDVTGGAETAARYYANLLKSDFTVNVLTTTATDFTTWENALPGGHTIENGIHVDRFPVNSGRGESWDNLLEHLIRFWKGRRSIFPDASIRERLIDWPLALQEEWIRQQGPHSRDLIRFLAEHSHEYHKIIFFTYLYSPTYFGSYETKKKQSILVSTLHDEIPAYLSAFGFMADRFSLHLWNTEQEKEFSEQLWGKRNGSVIGYGISVPEESDLISLRSLSSAGRIQEITRTKQNEFLLYSGRIDVGKGCADMIQRFIRWKSAMDETDVNWKLVLTGKLHMDLPQRDDIVYAGFVSEEDKQLLMANARVFILPSPMESLSIALLEAMSFGTPALVNGESPVLQNHAVKSEGALFYRNEEEFIRSLNQLIDDTGFHDSLAANARKYVQSHYDPDRMKSRLLEILR